MLLNQELIMANSLSGKLKGGKYKQKLQFVPCADNEEPQVGHEISEPAIFRFLLNEETMGKFDEADEVEIVKMLDVLKDIDKQSEITHVEAHQSSMRKMTDALKAFHVFIVFKTCATDGVYWWSLEKNTEYIVLQRSRNKNNVKNKLEGKQRTRVKLVEKDLKGKGTIKDLFAILWAHQMIQENYNILNSNCQFLVTFVGQQITEIGYKYKGNFPYSPPPEKGRDKQMLELINAIRGCSDWSPLFHLIAIGNTNLVDIIVASGMYDINASCNGLTPLHLAIRLKKTEMVKHLLKRMNADPTKREASGKSALLLAVSTFEMNAEIMDVLLKHKKVNVDDVDEDGKTALHWAAWASNVNIFRKLLGKEANPNIVDKKGRSPLHLAARQMNGNKIIDLLLAHSKVKVDDVDGKGQTALHIAAYESNDKVVKYLINKGANPNITNKWGYSPLYYAVRLRYKMQSDGNEIIDLLLAHDKFNVDDVNEFGHTALHWSAGESNVIAVQKLLEKGANPNIQDKQGWSPLHVAATKSNTCHIIDLLLEAKKVKGLGDVNDANKQGMTALHYATAFSKEVTAEHLIKKGANVNRRDNQGYTPLHDAALGAKDMKIIDLLLQNINERDIEQYKNDERLFFFARYNLYYGPGNSILDRLVQKGIKPPRSTKTDDCITAESDDEATGVNTRRFVDKDADPSIDLTGFDGLDFLLARVKISLEIYDDINGRDKYGKTLLFFAIRDINVNWVRRLLEKGADPTIRDEHGYTPFHVAVINYADPDILNLLLESGKVDINETTDLGMTALHWAVIESTTAAAEFLLSKGANPNAADKDGVTPLHFAIKYAKNMDMVKLLLNQEKVDVNYLDNKGNNALEYARNYLLGEKMVNLLKKKGAVELPKRNNESLEKLLKYTSSDAVVEIENVLSDATVPNEDQIARIKKENLISAITDWDVESVRLLLKDGADISSCCGEMGTNALHMASCFAKTTELIDVVLETGIFDINGVDNNGSPPLHWAIATNILEIVRHLIRKGADPTIANKEGDTPLHLAARHEEGIETISLILENERVDINSRGKNEWTALHYAIEASQPDTVRYLLKKGADPNAAYENGATPLHLAAKEDYRETTELIDIILETGKCNINAVDNDGRTPLHYAIERYAPVTRVRRLIEMGADPGIADKNGVTPLHMAAENAYSMDLIDELLLKVKTGAVDVNSVDNQGRTPLAWARDNKRERLGQRIIDRLKEYGAKE